MVLPLDGTQVLDFSRAIPGGVASMILGDFGADVLWVEEPRTAKLDLAFHRADQVSRAYNRMASGKRSIVLNLRDRSGQDIALKLAAQSDVVLTEFRPGIPERLGIGYETLRAVNPRLVYCEITLYGLNGPYAGYPGHDASAQAVSGMIARVGDEDCPLNYAGLPLVDTSTSYHAVIGILLALRARESTGQGQHLDIAMLDSALDYQISLSPSHFQGRRIRRPNKRNPSSGVWQCKDGKYICTTNVEPHHWANFCNAIGHDEFIPLQYDRKSRHMMYDKVKEVFLTRTREDWLKTFRQADSESQAAPVYELEEVFDDPQVEARRMVVTREHPIVGPVKQQGISIKLGNTPGRLGGFAPLPGQHTVDVLTSLGFSASDIQKLVAEQAVAVSSI